MVRRWCGASGGGPSRGGQLMEITCFHVKHEPTTLWLGARCAGDACNPLKRRLKRSWAAIAQARKKPNPLQTNMKRIQPLTCWSGRQDLNLRPPGPELPSGSFPLVRRSRTALQALEMRKGEWHAKLPNPLLATTCEARLVAPVSPATMRRHPTSRANRFSRSRKSRPDWASAAQSPTVCASEVNCRMSASRTRSASRLPRWPSTWLWLANMYEVARGVLHCRGGEKILNSRRHALRARAWRCILLTDELRVEQGCLLRRALPLSARACPAGA